MVFKQLIKIVTLYILVCSAKILGTVFRNMSHFHSKLVDFYFLSTNNTEILTRKLVGQT